MLEHLEAPSEEEQPSGSVASLRPKVDLRPGELHVASARAARALGSNPRVFQRDRRLVSVVEDDETGVAIRPLALPTLKAALSESARFQKRASNGRARACDPSNDVVGAVHAAGEWPSVPKLAGVLEAPAARRDGSIIQMPGYDVRSRYLFLPAVPFPKVPESPSREDAARAYRALRDCFRDFPFIHEAAREVPIAAILTLLCRPAIDGSIPLHAVDASTRGTGKTLVVDTISVIARGRPAAKMNFPASLEELEKVLASCAISGAPLIAFDNAAGAIGGGPLDRCLTAGREVELRPLGRTEIQTVRWNALVTATANNLALVGDTARRTIVGRMESTLERPEDRQDFSHPNLLEWARSERPRLVCAALTMARAWYVAGSPLLSKLWGSFEAWSSVVPSIILFSGGANVLEARAEIVGTDDPDRAALVTVLEMWAKIEQGAGISIATALQVLYPERRELVPPDGYDELRTAIEHLAGAVGGGRPPPALRLASAFRKLKGRVIGGKRLETRPGRSGTLRWTVGVVGTVGHTGPDSSLQADAPFIPPTSSPPTQPSQPLENSL